MHKKMLHINLVLAFVLFQAFNSFAFASTTKEDARFPYQAQLDDSYRLLWRFNQTHITFKVEVSTTGWVALGVSPNGRMWPADVTVGWVAGGAGHVADMHTTDHVAPVIDARQDVTLLGASESQGFTSLTFTRKLVTCDNEDTPILEGTTRVIWSYGAADPQGNAESIAYHGPRRGARSLLLLDPPPADSLTPPPAATVKTIDFFNKNYTVPGDKDTDYRCLGFSLPDLGGVQHHMIRYEPVVTPGNERAVHHILLYYCEGHVDRQWDGLSYDCLTERPPQVRSCYAVMAAWAIGGQAFDFPEVAGFSVGGAGNPSFFLMEMHYDNPDLRSDIVDSSGIRITVTSQLRRHEAGVLLAGVEVDRKQIIPARAPQFLSRGYCSPHCLGRNMPDTGIHVFANLLHSHLIGYALRTRVVRNGTELPPLAQDNNYDFNYQESRKLPQEYVLHKGDGLVVECLYKAAHKNTTTFGGLSTHEEMCESFLMYYPKMATAGCVTSLQYPSTPGHSDIESWVAAQDWSNATSHAQFQTLVDAATVSEACYGGPNTIYDYMHPPVYRQPALLPRAPYTPPRVCP